MFKTNINNFRAISIILVVFGHCYFFGISTFAKNDELYVKVIRNLISGGSAFFVYISGFLFLKVYKSNTQYILFVTKKIKNVYIPFILFISLDFFYLIIKCIYSKFMNNSKLELYYNALKNLDFYSSFVLGKSFISLGFLWYIPFIMCFYFFSPIFFKYSGLKIRVKVLIFVVCALLSLFLFRNYSYSRLSILQNVIYFIPFYLVGILSYQHENWLLNNIKIYHKSLMILLVIILTFSNNLLPKIFVKNIDIILIQKLTLCIYFLSTLNNFDFRNYSLLNKFADYSYGIYFLHPLLILVIGQVIELFSFSYKSSSLLIYLLSASLVLFSSLVAVIYLRKFMGKASKYIIGV